MYDISSLRSQILSEDLEVKMDGIVKAISLNDEIGDLLIENLNASDNRFVVTEKTSMFFWSFLQKLKGLLSSTDRDLSFWAASLIVHYEIKNATAEEIMFDAVEKGEEDHACIASTILFRTKNSKLKHLVVSRLNNKSTIAKEKEFFLEKLEDLNNREIQK